MITFTGSVPVGEQIRAQTGLRRVTLELGSNSSVILEPDCDLDTMIPRCVTGSFTHSGQVCISVQNIYVHETIEKTFTERFVAATQKLKIGHPLEESTDVSSLITTGEAERVEEWIERARAAWSAGAYRGEAAKRHARADHPHRCGPRPGGLLPRGLRAGGGFASLPVSARGDRCRECRRVRVAGGHLHARHWQSLPNRPSVTRGRSNGERCPLPIVPTTCLTVGLRKVGWGARGHSSSWKR